MLEAFISDLKKELSFLTLIRRLNAKEWFHVFWGITAIAVFTYGINAKKCWLLIIESLLFLFLIIKFWVKKFKGLGIKGTYKLLLRKWKDTEGYLNGEKTHAKWFHKKRINRVDSMLKNSNTGLKENACIELLLKECDEKLKETRKSDIVYNRMKPLNVPFALVFIGLSTAYLNNKYVTETAIAYESSLIEWAMNIISLLAKDIISNPHTLTLFLVVCGLLFLLYLVAVFIIWPILAGILDRDWILTKEIKDSLLYIKHKKYFKPSKDHPNE